jgi:hypothetical protein
MNSLRIEIINPKATRLLKDLEDLNLISIKVESKLGFMDVLNRLRSKSKQTLSIEEITKEVETVRAKRYQK